MKLHKLSVQAMKASWGKGEAECSLAEADAKAFAAALVFVPDALARAYSSAAVRGYYARIWNMFRAATWHAPEAMQKRTTWYALAF